MNTVQKNSDGEATKVRLTFDNWLGLAGILLTMAGGLWVLLDRRLTVLESSLLDHEIRLTKREANSFTAQEANILSNNVARLTIELASQEKAIDRLLKELKE